MESVYGETMVGADNADQSKMAGRATRCEVAMCAMAREAFCDAFPEHDTRQKSTVRRARLLPCG